MVAPSDVPHPGTRIKVEVIPMGMSVTEAAQLMGVGRPALSNLLNGNAALSADMAARLEKAFKYPLKDLMEMQARYEAAQAKGKDAPANTKAYVPPFLAIKANDIEGWVSHNIPSRTRLAVFLRTLVHSTGRGLTKVDFPGNDDAERAGWDGFVEASEGTPWVPAGRSGWEFGTNEDPKAKADGDFEKSVKGLDKKDREGMTFVFVTPRRWSEKADWVDQEGERTLEGRSSLRRRAILSNGWSSRYKRRRGSPTKRTYRRSTIRSLDKCWADWANVSAPPLTGALFSSAIEATKRTMLSRLSKPSEGPILIAAELDRRGACLPRPTTWRARRRRTGLISRPSSGVR